MAVEIIGDKAAASHLRATGERAGHQHPAMALSARQALRAVSDVPRDTGRLAGSIKVLHADDHGFDIGSDVRYARYVFRGTRYMPARPPRVDTSKIAGETARAVAHDLERA